VTTTIELQLHTPLIMIEKQLKQLKSMINIVATTLLETCSMWVNTRESYNDQSTYCSYVEFNTNSQMSTWIPSTLKIAHTKAQHAMLEDRNPW